MKSVYLYLLSCPVLLFMLRIFTLKSLIIISVCSHPFIPIQLHGQQAEAGTPGRKPFPSSPGSTHLEWHFIFPLFTYQPHTSATNRRSCRHSYLTVLSRPLSQLQWSLNQGCTGGLLHIRLCHRYMLISDIEDTVNPLSADSQSQQTALKEHSEKLVDLEDHLRRNNLCFIDLPEVVEGKDPESFLENLLKSLVGRDILSLFAIEWAHRVSMRPPPSDTPPRPLLVKLFLFRDKENILRVARNLPDIKFNGNCISILPDFLAATQNRGQPLHQLKKPLETNNSAIAICIRLNYELSTMANSNS